MLPLNHCWVTVEKYTEKAWCFSSPVTISLTFCIQNRTHTSGQKAMCTKFGDCQFNHFWFIPDKTSKQIDRHSLKLYPISVQWMRVITITWHDISVGSTTVSYLCRVDEGNNYYLAWHFSWVDINSTIPVVTRSTTIVSNRADTRHCWHASFHLGSKEKFLKHANWHANSLGQLKQYTFNTPDYLHKRSSSSSSSSSSRSSSSS